MKNLLIILLLSSLAFGQNQKPMLGEMIDYSNPLSKNLLGCWLMNESAGNKVFDLSGNGHTGILTQGPVWKAGKYGSCVSFAGDDDYIELGDKDVFSFTDGAGNDVAFSISTWVNIVEKDNEGIVTKHYNTGGSYEWMFYHSSDDIWFSMFISDGSAYIGRRHRWLDASWYNQWIHLVCTYDGSESSAGMKIYKNAVRVDDDENSSGAYTGMSNTSQTLKIGNGRGDTWPFQGLIDNVIIWRNRVLSESEIALLYREPFSMFEDDEMEILQSAIAAPSIVPTPYYYRAIPPVIILIPISLFAYFGRRRCAA